ncbi:MAG: Crp/Fnr family transcriptional regulator [Burkholderiaceae bacterium]
MPRPTAPGDTLALIRRALRCCALFRDWPDIAVDRMARIARLQRYERRTQVLAQDRQRREVLVVVSGCLEVGGMNEAGAKFVLSMLGPGEVVALVRLLKDVPWIYDYHAREDTVLVHLPSDALRAVLDDTPLLWKDVALLALKRQHESIVSMQRRALGRLQQSLAETLVKLAGWHGQPIDHGPAISLRVSQSELASMLSVSRQTMNKELRLLAQQGLLTADYGQLTILDLAALQRMAEGRR